MPRDMSGVFAAPAGTLATSGTAIESAKYNAWVNDLVAELNTAIPLVRGGTGTTTVAGFKAAFDLEIGVDVQAYSAALASLAGLTTAANKMVYTTAANTYAVTDLSAFARTILDDADAAAVLATIGAQPADAALTSLAGISLAAGDILYATGADTLVRLPKGTAGQQLRMNSGATAPEWGTGGRDTIFSTTVSSAVAAIDITTFDVAKYSHYQIFLQGLKPVTAAQLLMRLSTDGGATFISTTAAYIDQYTILTNGGQSQAYGNSTAIAVRGGGNVKPTYGIDGMIDLFGLGESGRTVAIRQIRTVDNADNSIYEYGNGARVLDEAHNAIRFFFSTGNIASGTIIVEGIRR